MNILRLDDINGVLDARLNILHFEIGVVIPNDRFKRNRFTDQFQDGLHRNARPGNAWLPKMNFGADLNSIHATNIPHFWHERQVRQRYGDCQLIRPPMKSNPTAKQPARSRGAGAASKKPSWAKGHLNFFPRHLASVGAQDLAKERR